MQDICVWDVGASPRDPCGGNPNWQAFGHCRRPCKAGGALLDVNIEQQKMIEHIEHTESERNQERTLSTM